MTLFLLLAAANFGPYLLYFLLHFYSSQLSIYVRTIHTDICLYPLLHCRRKHTYASSVYYTGRQSSIYPPTRPPPLVNCFCFLVSPFCCISKYNLFPHSYSFISFFTLLFLCLFFFTVAVPPFFLTLSIALNSRVLCVIARFSIHFTHSF